MMAPVADHDTAVASAASSSTGQQSDGTPIPSSALSRFTDQVQEAPSIISTTSSPTNRQSWGEVHLPMISIGSTLTKDDSMIAPGHAPASAIHLPTSSTSSASNVSPLLSTADKETTTACPSSDESDNEDHDDKIEDEDEEVNEEEVTQADNNNQRMLPHISFESITIDYQRSMSLSLLRLKHSNGAHTLHILRRSWCELTGCSNWSNYSKTLTVPHERFYFPLPRKSSNGPVLVFSFEGCKKLLNYLPQSSQQNSRLMASIWTFLSFLQSGQLPPTITQPTNESKKDEITTTQSQSQPPDGRIESFTNLTTPNRTDEEEMEEDHSLVPPHTSFDLVSFHYASHIPSTTKPIEIRLLRLFRSDGSHNLYVLNPSLRQLDGYASFISNVKALSIPNEKFFFRLPSQTGSRLKKKGGYERSCLIFSFQGCKKLMNHLPPTVQQDPKFMKFIQTLLSNLQTGVLPPNNSSSSSPAAAAFATVADGVQPMELDDDSQPTSQTTIKVEVSNEQKMNESRNHHHRENGELESNEEKQCEQMDEDEEDVEVVSEGSSSGTEGTSADLKRSWGEWHRVPYEEVPDMTYTAYVKASKLLPKTRQFIGECHDEITAPVCDEPWTLLKGAATASSSNPFAQAAAAASSSSAAAAAAAATSSSNPILPAMPPAPHHPPPRYYDIYRRLDSNNGRIEYRLKANRFIPDRTVIGFIGGSLIEAADAQMEGLSSTQQIRLDVGYLRQWYDYKGTTDLVLSTKNHSNHFSRCMRDPSQLAPNPLLQRRKEYRKKKERECVLLQELQQQVAQTREEAQEAKLAEKATKKRAKQHWTIIEEDDDEQDGIIGTPPIILEPGTKRRAAQVAKTKFAGKRRSTSAAGVTSSTAKSAAVSIASGSDDDEDRDAKPSSSPAPIAPRASERCSMEDHPVRTEIFLDIANRVFVLVVFASGDIRRGEEIKGYAHVPEFESRDHRNLFIAARQNHWHHRNVLLLEKSLLAHKISWDVHPDEDDQPPPALTIEQELKCLGTRQERNPAPLSAMKKPDLWKRIDLASALEATNCKNCPRPQFGNSIPQELRDAIAEMDDFIPFTVKVHDETIQPVTSLAAGSIVTAQPTKEVRVDPSAVRHLINSKDMHNPDQIEVREVVNILHPVRRYTPPWWRSFAVAAKQKIEPGTFVYCYSGVWAMKQHQMSRSRLQQEQSQIKRQQEPSIEPSSTRKAAARDDTCAYCSLVLTNKNRYTHKPFCSKNPANMSFTAATQPPAAAATKASSIASSSDEEHEKPKGRGRKKKIHAKKDKVSDDEPMDDVPSEGEDEQKATKGGNDPIESTSAYIYSFTPSVIRAQIPDFRLPAAYEAIPGYPETEAEFVVDAERHGGIGRFVNDVRWRTDNEAIRNVDNVFVIYKGMVHLAIFATRTIHAGEELMTDYGEHFWRVMDAQLMEAHLNYRKYILGYEKRLMKLARSYGLPLPRKPHPVIEMDVSHSYPIPKLDQARPKRKSITPATPVGNSEDATSSSTTAVVAAVVAPEDPVVDDHLQLLEEPIAAPDRTDHHHLHFRPKKKPYPQHVQEEPDETEWSVEKIIGKGQAADGEIIYEVKWLGYPESENTWEPIGNLESCLEMVARYNAELDAASPENKEWQYLDSTKQTVIKRTDLQGNVKRAKRISNTLSVSVKDLEPPKTTKTTPSTTVAPSIDAAAAAAATSQSTKPHGVKRKRNRKVHLDSIRREKRLKKLNKHPSSTTAGGTSGANSLASSSDEVEAEDDSEVDVKQESKHEEDEPMEEEKPLSVPADVSAAYRIYRQRKEAEMNRQHRTTRASTTTASTNSNSTVHPPLPPPPSYAAAVGLTLVSPSANKRKSFPHDSVQESHTSPHKIARTSIKSRTLRASLGPENDEVEIPSLEPAPATSTSHHRQSRTSTTNAAAAATPVAQTKTRASYATPTTAPITPAAAASTVTTRSSTTSPSVASSVSPNSIGLPCKYCRTDLSKESAVAREAHLSKCRNEFAKRATLSTSAKKSR